MNQHTMPGSPEMLGAQPMQRLADKLTSLVPRLNG